MSSAEITTRINNSTSYGAAEIKRFIRKNTYISFVNTIVLFSSLFLAWYSFNLFKEINENPTSIPKAYVPIEILVNVTIPNEPINIKPIDKLNFTTEKIAGNPKASDIIDDIKKEFAGWDKMDISSSNTDGVLVDDITKLIDIVDKPEKIENISKPIEINPEYNFTDVEMEPIVDIDGLMKTIEYPAMAIKANIEGRVIISALVGINGLVLKSKVFLSVSDVLDKEALRAVSNFRFIPAVQNGNPVNCWVNIPINFKLK